MRGYRYLPHTADIKIEAWGKDLEEAFENAARAFTNIVVDISRITPINEHEVEVEGSDLEELLYNFIEKLILKLELEEMIFSDYDVSISSCEKGFSLRCICRGEKIDIIKHVYKTHVKAITYHEMEIKKEKNKFFIRFVVDI